MSPEEIANGQAMRARLQALPPLPPDSKERKSLTPFFRDCWRAVMWTVPLLLVLLGLVGILTR